MFKAFKKHLLDRVNNICNAIEMKQEKRKGMPIYYRKVCKELDTKELI